MHRQRARIVARFVRRFLTFLREACVLHGFRVVHYAIHHLHLLVEA